MMLHPRTWLAIAAAAALLVPDASFAATSYKERAQRTKLTVHAKPRHWRGYGYLPGYRPSLAESQGTPVYGAPLPRREVRYIDWYGNVRYGWGYPRFYRGQWNGGGFGPCWATTPIGPMPTCN